MGIKLLEDLGVKGHQDYALVVHALEMLAANRHLLNQTLELYTHLGDILHMQPQNVSRRIHTVAKRAWMNNRPYLEEIAGYPLPRVPKTGEFLAMLHVYSQMTR